MAAERIELTVPARAEYARAVRIIAATLASRLGMSIDEVDDVRLAIEETFLLASTRCDDDDVVKFQFDVDETRMDVSVGPVPSLGTPSGDEDASGRYSRFILEAVCDAFEVAIEGDSCFLRLTKIAGEAL